MVDVGHTLVVVGSEISLPDPDIAGYFCTNKGVCKHAQTAQKVGVHLSSVIMCEGKSEYLSKTALLRFRIRILSK